MNFINTYFSDLLHLLYPERCAGCSSDLISKGKVLCLNCIDQLPVTNYFRLSDNPVEKVFWGRLPIVAAAALVYFTKQSVMQRLLHQFKYRGNREIGLFFGRIMGDEIKQSGRFKEVDALIPLPLHFQKQKKRGYNQASVICEGISQTMKVPILNNAIIRKSKTATQTHMNRTERWKNIGGKFELAEKKTLSGRHVLLIDDVITTGATLEACGCELQKAEGVKLSIASLAYTLR